MNKKMTVIAVSATLFLLAGLSFAIPSLMPDGTQKFSGIQKEVALKAATEVDYEYSGLENIVEKMGFISLRLLTRCGPL
ncbi:MAG TPA: hypothetical protein VFT87_01380 [Candidatus Saccharimonadales bacterium]|nr:hypothetical protein [Candidatus Saccharimonadales bacterium]